MPVTGGFAPKAATRTSQNHSSIRLSCAAHLLIAQYPPSNGVGMPQSRPELHVAEHVHVHNPDAATDISQHGDVLVEPRSVSIWRTRSGISAAADPRS